MPHLAKFRTGWSNENLAQFILYKFALLNDIFSERLTYHCKIYEEILGVNSSYSLNYSMSDEEMADTLVNKA